MQIYVNDEKLDATLNGEKNLKEVYGFIDSWLSQSKRYILNTSVDQKEVPLNSLAEIPIDTVKRFDFHVGDEMDMLLSSVRELDLYIDQVGSTLFEREKLKVKEVRDLKEGLKWCREILQSISSMVGLSLNAMQIGLPMKSGQGLDPQGKDSGEKGKGAENVASLLECLEKRLQTLKEDHSSSDIESFLIDLRVLKSFVIRLEMQLRSMAAEPDELVKVIDDFANYIPNFKEKLVDINASFQKGRDLQALDALEQISANLNLCITALYAVDYRTQKGGESKITELSVDSLSFYEAASELASLLQELSNALEEGDIVAVGDILEYELTEKLDKLQVYLREISKYCRECFKESQKDKEKTACLTSASQ